MGSLRRAEKSFPYEGMSTFGIQFSYKTGQKVSCQLQRKMFCGKSSIKGEKKTVKKSEEDEYWKTKKNKKMPWSEMNIVKEGKL